MEVSSRKSLAEVSGRKSIVDDLAQPTSTSKQSVLSDVNSGTKSDPIKLPAFVEEIVEKFPQLQGDYLAAMDFIERLKIENAMLRDQAKEQRAESERQSKSTAEFYEEQLESRSQRLAELQKLHEDQLALMRRDADERERVALKRSDTAVGEYVRLRDNLDA